jgi:hypothetical protein
VAGLVARALDSAQYGGPSHYELPGRHALHPVSTYDPSLPSLRKVEMMHMG